jgi:hypothetical protein
MGKKPRGQRQLGNRQDRFHYSGSPEEPSTGFRVGKCIANLRGTSPTVREGPDAHV